MCSLSAFVRISEAQRIILYKQMESHQADLPTLSIPYSIKFKWLVTKGTKKKHHNYHLSA